MSDSSWPPYNPEGSVKRMFIPRSAYAGFEIRTEDRRGRQGTRVADGHRRGGRLAEASAPAQARRDAGDAADPDRGTAARGDRSTAPDAAGAHRRAAGHVARHDEAEAQLDLSSEARPQHPARRGAGADGRGHARGAAAQRARWATRWSTSRSFRSSRRRSPSSATPSPRRLAMPLLLREGRLVVALEDPVEARRDRRGRVPAPR